MKYRSNRIILRIALPAALLALICIFPLALYADPQITEVLPTILDHLSGTEVMAYLTKAGAVIGVIALTMIAVIVLRRLVRRLILGTSRGINRSMRPVFFRGVRILRPQLLARWATGFIKVLHLLLYLAAIYYVATYGLDFLSPDLREVVAPVIRGGLSVVLLLFTGSLVYAGLRSLFRIGEKKIHSLLLPQIRPLRWRGVEFFSAVQARSILSNGYRLIQYAVFLTSGYLFLVLLFSFFAFSSDWAGLILDYSITPLKSLFAGLVAYLPDLFFLIITFVVLRFVLRFLRSFFEGLSAGRTIISGFHPEWADTTYKIVTFILLAFAAVLVFPYLPGSDSEAFKGVGLFLGFLLSLGSTAIIANIVAGTVLTYMRPFKIGDRVKIADTVGDVVEKTILVTRIRTPKNVEVTVPNGLVLGAHIVNYSAIAETAGVILHTTVTIGYDVPWQTVHRLLLESARRTENLLESPKPFILQTELTDFSVSYELNGYTRKPQQMATIYSEMHRNILDCFNEAGVEILSPHYQADRDGNESTVPQSYRKRGPTQKKASAIEARKSRKSRQ